MNGSPSQIGHYAIERELGRGGMGVVYLARDTRLDRNVAIKALPEHLMNDDDRLARFQREAKTLAQLHHPNIASIFGIEEQQGARYLVLEYVEGETLESRLERGTLPLDETLDICAKIAAGVEAAHEAGVIHRDLKPGNIIIRSDGAVKVLDFGLAKSLERTSSSTDVPSESPTLTSPVGHSPTMPGAILGTAPYMSPEQARGKIVDKRTDIWSLGVILYECLTGLNPFNGETTSDCIAAILHKDPKYDKLPLATPAFLRHVLQRCLERDRELRWRDIGDVRLELERALKHPPDDQRDAAVAPPKSSRLRNLLIELVVSILIVATVFYFFQPFKSDEIANSNQHIVEFVLDVPDTIKLPDMEGDSEIIAVSDQGDKLAIVSFDNLTSYIYVRDLTSTTMREVVRSKDAWGPCFSPDGQWLAYFDSQRLVKVRVQGGPSQLICPVQYAAGTVAWLQNDTILFPAGDNGLFATHAAGGEQTLLIECPAQATYAGRTMNIYGFLQAKPIDHRNEALLSFWAGDTVDDQNIGIISLDDNTITPIVLNGVQPQMLGDDILIFLRRSTLMAVPIDLDDKKIIGDPVPVLEDVWASGWADEGTYALSPNGTLIYAPGDRIGDGRRIARITPDGAIEPLSEPNNYMGGVCLSPDEKRVTASTLDRIVALWVFDLERRTPTMIESQGESYGARWTPDGQYLTFTHGVGRRERIARKRADGSGTREDIIAPGEFGDELWVIGWMPDGKTLVLAENEVGKIYQFQPGQKAELLIDLHENIDNIELSPDGRAIAYSAKQNIYMHPVADIETRVQVSFTGGWRPQWSADGKQLYYRTATNMLNIVDITYEPRLQAGPPRELFSDKQKIAPDSWSPDFDIDSKGNIYAIMPADWELAPAQYRVIVNWDRRVREKLGMTGNQ